MKYAFLLIILLFIVACQIQVPSDLKSDEHGTEVLVVEPDEDMDAEWITYGDNFKGYLVKPMTEGKFPGIVMIHEWWGLNQNIKNMAHDLAEEGFVVIAVDLFDGKVADNPDDARTYSSEVRDDMDKAITHLKSAVAYLNSNENVLEDSIASLGWCFGGGMSMQLSLQEELAATVIYYGALETDKEKLASINWPILGIFGEEDRSITVQSVNEFGAALDDIGIENEIYIYDGVGHAFANPSNAGHDPQKTEDAWMKTIAFLNRNLKGQ